METKPLKKIESLSQLLTKRALPRGARGLDTDLLFRTKRGWIVLEFLRSDRVPVHKSHPRFYWDKNWRKFVTLWHLARDLRARFFLINYAFDGENFGPFHVLRSKMHPSDEPREDACIVTAPVRYGVFVDFQRWLVMVDMEVERTSVSFCYYCQGHLAMDLIRCSGCEANACRACVGRGWVCERCSV